MWGHHFLKTSLRTPAKDFRVVKPENWVSKPNSCPELGSYLGVLHPKTKSKLAKLEKWKVDIWRIVFAYEFVILHRKDHVWSSPPCNPSPESKDCRVVKPENWVGEFDIVTKLGLYVRSSHLNTMSEMTNPFSQKQQKNRVLNYDEIIYHKKEHIWCFVSEVIRFNL